VDSELLNFLAAAVIVLVAAKLGGYASIRIGQPSVLGELLVGIILGPTVLNMLGGWPLFAADAHLSASLTLFAEIGVILLMFLAGLELDLRDLLRSGRVAGLAGVMGVVIPLAGGYLTARLFGIETVEAIFIGLALSATSVSISAQTLMELGVLRSKVGLGLLGAAVFDDILVVLLLSGASVVFGTADSGAGLGIILLRMVLFLVGGSAVGVIVLPRFMARVEDLPISQAVPTAALVVCFLFAWASEALGGMAAITGAFMAGLFLARTPYSRPIEHGLSTMAYSLFVPIFLVNIGLQANLRAISGAAWYSAIALTVVAIISKVIGSGLGALVGGFDRRDSLRLGVGMISRGEVGLIVASVALGADLVSQETFSGVVFMVIVATLVTPPLLRLTYRDDEPAPAANPRPEKPGN
jgi:Kef-type K+ transport system membrane component KefB